jgi:hypothetical protein
MTDEVRNKPRTGTDWERVEADYRAGIRTLRVIAEEHGITEGAIRKRAKRDDWTRSLAAKIKAKADDLVRKELVRNEVRKDTPTEREVVDAGANQVATVILTHRTDIARYRKLAAGLIDELEQEKKDFKTLGPRIGNMKAAADTLKTLIGLERTAFNLDSSDEADQDAAKQFIETMLHGRARAAAR